MILFTTLSISSTETLNCFVVIIKSLKPLKILKSSHDIVILLSLHKIALISNKNYILFLI